MNPFNVNAVKKPLLGILLIASVLVGCHSDRAGDLADIQGKHAPGNIETKALPEASSGQTIVAQSPNLQVQATELGTEGQVNVRGNLRSYLLYVPSSYQSQRPMPLVLAFHGGSGTGSGFAINTGFNQLADRYGFIVAYPNGLSNHWNDGRGAVAVGNDDTSFADTLIDRLATTYHIDRSRVYAVGMSNGGIFTQRLACQSTKIAAFASVAGSLAAPLASTCQPERPVSMLMINGTDDPIVPWDGGTVGRGRGEVLGVIETAQMWRQFNRCPHINRQFQPNRDAQDGTSIEVVRTQRCQNGAEVVLVRVEGGGHSWPGGTYNSQGRTARLSGNISRELNASDYIWQFLQRHSL